MPLSRWSGRLKHCHLLDENGYLPASILKQAADHKIGRAPAPTFAGHSERQEKSTSEARPPAGLGRAPGPPPPASPSQGKGSKGLIKKKKTTKKIHQQNHPKPKTSEQKAEGCGMLNNFPACLGAPGARARSGAVGWSQASRHCLPGWHGSSPGFVNLNVTRADRANVTNQSKVFFLNTAPYASVEADTGLGCSALGTQEKEKCPTAGGAAAARSEPQESLRTIWTGETRGNVALHPTGQTNPQ